MQIYLQCTWPEYIPVVITTDCQITNETLENNDTTIWFDARGFGPGDKVWVAGHAEFEDSYLKAFASYDDALTYALSKSSLVGMTPKELDEALYQKNAYTHGDGAQDWTDIILIEKLLTLPDNGRHKC